jgi:hypothetical protein
VRRHFGRRPDTQDDPKAIVALGAAGMPVPVPVAAPPPPPPKPKPKPVPVTDRTPAPLPVVDRTPVAPTAGSATAALIVGLAGIVMCPPLLPSIAAIIVGHKARREIAAAGGRVGGDNLAKWGIVAGWARIPWTILLFWAVLSTPA